MEELRGYSKEYFQMVRAVPDLVENVLRQVTPDLEDNSGLSDTIKKNLEEEKRHIPAWVSFAESIGIMPNELYNYECSGKTQDAIMNMSELTLLSFASGISALYTYEKQLPQISAKKIEGLVNFYGVQNDRALEYFRIHQKVDIEHAEFWRSLLESMPRNLHRSILDAASKSLEYQNMILDGVCDTCLKERDQLPN